MVCLTWVVITQHQCSRISTRKLLAEETGDLFMPIKLEISKTPSPESSIIYLKKYELMVSGMMSWG